MCQVTPDHLTAILTAHEPPCISLYQPMHRRHPENGKPLVYIDYLETAPWNWNLRDIGQYGEIAGLAASYP